MERRYWLSMYDTGMIILYLILSKNYLVSHRISINNLKKMEKYATAQTDWHHLTNLTYPGSNPTNCAIFSSCLSPIIHIFIFLIFSFVNLQIVK